jgi:hypothetical protein
MRKRQRTGRDREVVTNRDRPGYGEVVEPRNVPAEVADQNETWL